MNYHLFQKDSQSVFSKKIKSKSKSQNKERMTWTLYKLSISLHYFIWSPHLPNFTTKVACICIPKNHVDYIDSLHLNVQIFWIWDDRLSRWVDLLLSHKGGPLGTSYPHRWEDYTSSPWEGCTPSPSEGYTPSPLEDYTSSPLEDYTSSHSVGYTPSPSEDYTSSSSEGCTPSPSKGDTSWTSEGCTPSPLEGYASSLSVDSISTP